LIVTGVGDWASNIPSTSSGMDRNTEGKDKESNRPQDVITDGTTHPATQYGQPA
jgi:hypothetical protein